MRACDFHRAAEVLFGAPLRSKSVKDALAPGVTESGRFERVSYGVRRESTEGECLEREIMLEVVTRCSASRAHVELAIDRAEMRVDGADADDETLRNLCIG